MNRTFTLLIKTRKLNISTIRRTGEPELSTGRERVSINIRERLGIEMIRAFPGIAKRCAKH